MVETMRRNGALREFNAAYKIRRAGGTARSEGFMGIGIAMARFKRALMGSKPGRCDRYSRKCSGDAELKEAAAITRTAKKHGTAWKWGVLGGRRDRAGRQFTVGPT
jgi:hypothetical protein